MILLRVLLVLFLFATATLLPCCRKSDESKTVVLYSSVDGDFLRPVIDRFTAQTGIKVLIVGDTEATKTTGLVQRLIAEKERPRADVWWSSEVLGTVQLSRAGLLEPYTSAANEKDFPGGWPKDQRGKLGDWYGFAQRPRTMVFRADDTGGMDAKSPLREGVANPRFGTTRAHFAWQWLHFGKDQFADRFLNGAATRTVYAGNADVARAVAQGEVDFGFVDYDDFVSAKKNGWKLGCMPSHCAIPNTAAIVRGAAHPQAAKQLLDFILSAEVENLLAQSDSRNVPIRTSVRNQFPEMQQFDLEIIDWEHAADYVDDALDAWDKIEKK